MSNAPTIECKTDGPYLVKGLADLRTSSGQAIAAQPVMALCRCGGSSNKPFCDGTHRHNGFSGAKVGTAPAAAPADYRAPGITIHDDRSICAHAGRCTEGLASVFKYGSQPWIDPAGADVAAIVATIERCPSGALSCTLDSPQPAPQPLQPCIVVGKNGPYEVRGGIALVDAATGPLQTTARYTLCRCGGSKNKPLCDGTHWDIGFQDEKN